MKKGFTLIELMIVIAIIAIIAAIAIPNLMASRIRANEATAISAVKAYCAAQVTFQTARYGNNAGATFNSVPVPNGYTSDYPYLAWGLVPVGTGGARLNLISDAFATAAVATAATLPTGFTIGTPYQGYNFEEPADAPADYYNLQYAIVAHPGNSDTSGNNAYWCGVQGTVYMKGIAGGIATCDATAITNLNPTPTPTPGAIPAAWIVL